MASQLRYFIVLIPGGQENLGFPAIVAAAQVYWKARQARADRIRVEHANGVRVADFSMEQVRRFWLTSGLQPSLHRRAVPGEDFEPRRPVWTLTSAALKE